MTFWQWLSIIIGILFMAVVAWLAWKDATGREQRNQKRDIRDAEIVEMMRTTGHAMQAVTKLCNSTIKYLDDEGSAARRHYSDSIKSFFQAEKERKKILVAIESYSKPSPD